MPFTICAIYLSFPRFIFDFFFSVSLEILVFEALFIILKLRCRLQNKSKLLEGFYFYYKIKTTHNFVEFNTKITTGYTEMLRVLQK